MAIIELPKDEYSKRCEERGLDVCPIKLTGLDWIKGCFWRFGKKYSLSELDGEHTEAKTKINAARPRHSRV